MSYGRSGEDVKLRVNHRGGQDGFRQTNAVVVLDRVPADVRVFASVTQPTVLPQTDQGQRAALLGTPDTQGPARYVFERGARVRPRNAFGITVPGAGRGKVLVAGSAATFGKLGQLQVEPVWAPVGTSQLTVIDYTLGGTDTIVVTPLGGAALTITEATDFAAATNNATTAENIRVALLAIGIVAVRTGAVLAISTPLDAIASGDVTAWTVALSPPLLPALDPLGLVPKGREEASFTLAEDRPHLVSDSQVPAGELLRIRLRGATVETAQSQTAVGVGLTYNDRLQHAGGNALNIAPGSVVITFTDINGQTVIARDRGDGQLVGQAASPNLETVRGLIDYITGQFEFTFSDAAGAHTPTATYERDTLYNPLDVHLEWDAVLAY